MLGFGARNFDAGGLLEDALAHAMMTTEAQPAGHPFAIAQDAHSLESCEKWRRGANCLNWQLDWPRTSLNPKLPAGIKKWPQLVPAVIVFPLFGLPGEFFPKNGARWHPLRNDGCRRGFVHVILPPRQK